MHAVGVSLRFRGETIPNGSFVDLDDIMYTDPDDANTRDPPSIVIPEMKHCSV